MLPDYDILDDEITDDNFASELEAQPLPSLTHKLNSDMSIHDMIDGVDALKQSIYKVLSTERYRYGIYSFDYGIELEDLKEMSIRRASEELEDRIKDALMQDDRIESIDDFTAEIKNKHTILVSFIVNTNYDSFQIDKEVEINV